MFSSDTGAMADQHAETTRLGAERERVVLNQLRAAVGAATGLCVECGDEMTVTEALPGYRFEHVNPRTDHLARMWVVDSDGKPVLGESATATAAEQPDPSPGERLVASVAESYERHRQAGRLRPVNPYDVERMAHRMVDAAQDRLRYTFHPGQDSTEYRRASAAHERRVKALRRLAEALERQAGGGSR